MAELLNDLRTSFQFTMLDAFLCVDIVLAPFLPQHQAEAKSLTLVRIKH